MADALGSANAGIDQDPELICELELSGYHLCLRFGNNRMECRADLSPVTEASAAAVTDDAGDAESDSAESAAVALEIDEDPVENPTVEPAAEDDIECTPPQPRLPAYRLIELLQQHNITRDIDFAALYDLCAAVEEGSSRQGVLLARGKEPQTGADGWFEMMVKTSGEEIAFTEDRHGNVDLRTFNAYTEIEAGQKIGVLHQPQEGIPGYMVHGLSIPAERGSIYSLVAGDGVELKYDGRVAFAVKEGRALLERQVLSVVDQWVVSGDVDWGVGNIDYHGFVEIRGDVLDEFQVKSSKGIKVNGVAGACRLESDGSIEIASMTGKEVGEIFCHGDLRAGFLNHATVHCYGDVQVKNEIRNSQVKATGKIIVEQGSIIGGSCVALEGIEAKILGAPSGVETKLTAGVYFPDADRFDFLHERLHTVSDQIERLKSAIGPLEKLHDLDETTEKRLTILTEQWEKLEIEKEEVQAEIAASTRQDQETVNPKINVGSELLEGVRIRLGNSAHKYKIARKGPMSIIENSKMGGFRYLGLTPLAKTAAELEAEVLAEEARVAEEKMAVEAEARALADGDSSVADEVEEKKR